MNLLKLENYNLDSTLLGGQSFSWDKLDNKYIGTLNDNVLVIESTSDGILWQTYPELNNENFMKKYLNINSSYEIELKAISKDEYINSAITNHPGVRILNQDFEIIVLNFILTSHKSIKAVRKLTRDISKKYGNKVETELGVHYLFPKAEIISNLTEEELRKIGTGFRARYLKSAAEKICKDRNYIKNLKDLDIKEVKEYLLTYQGIGDKIADCILVFGLGFGNITPLDIWGKRVLTDFYKLDPKMSYKVMQEWYFNYFEENTALAGQFLFEYIRNMPKVKV